MFAIGVAAFAFLASSADAQQWWWPPTGGMTIDPVCPHPTAGIEITLSGDWPDNGVPKEIKAEVNGNVIDIVTDGPGGLLPVITPWKLSVEVGPLPAGTYEVYATHLTPMSAREYVGKFVVDPNCPAPCYPDCDGSGSLDLFDFLCFVNEFNNGNAYADCDGSGGLDLFDFLCFVNAFNAGCP
jgi:hypothetical protein